MRDIDKLCETLNNRVFDYNALIVDYSGSIPVIKVCPNYAIELSKGEIVATRKILFY